MSRGEKLLIELFVTARCHEPEAASRFVELLDYMRELEGRNRQGSENSPRDFPESAT